MKKKGGQLVIKDAPKKTPEQLKPWMRIVETIRAKDKAQGIKRPYSQVLKEAKKEYEKLNP